MIKDIQLPAWFNQYRTKVDALGLRERMLLFAAVIMLLFAIWYFAMMQPLLDRAASNRKEISTVYARINEMNNSLENQIMLFSSTGSEQRRQFDRIQNRIDDLNERLGDYASELIDPAEMTQVLEGVLRDKSNLRLVRVRNLDAEPLLGPDEALGTTLFKHGLEIEFEGSYFGCLEYLEDVEALPWRFYWRVLEIDVEDYPRSRIRLEVSTLSFDEEWIGA